MINFDKQEIRDQLSTSDIFDLLLEWGGNPQYTGFGIIAETIDHNPPGVGSRKLYYYENSGLFKSYTAGDDSFDIFELCIKVYAIQKQQEMNLNDAIRFIAFRFGISGSFIVEGEKNELEDWAIFSNYDRIQQVEVKTYDVKLKSYDKNILSVFNYDVKISPWLDEDISQEVLTYNKIGYFPGGNQITIPHFDKDGNFIGLRGRAMCQAECDIYGKYRPIIINQQMYNHPLGLNLYNLNNSKDNIQKMQTAIVFEGEKSVLLF